MKDYFSHDYYSRNDPKVVRLFMKHGLAGIGAYWCIVEMLYEEGGFLLLSEYERITFELRADESVIRYIIYDSTLFQNDNEKFWSETALERLKKREEKSEKARQSIENRWNKSKRNTNEIRTYNESNTIKVKESKVNNSKDNIWEKSNRFIPPILLEIENYCLERGNSVDPNKFLDFYQSKGWMVGKNKMKDWKAAVRNWEKSSNYGTKTNVSVSTSSSEMRNGVAAFVARAVGNSNQG